MLTKITKEVLSEAIHKDWPHILKRACDYFAEDYINNIDPIFEEAVQCWIDGKPIPNIVVGKYSVEDAMNIGRHMTNYLKVFKALSVYKDDPEKGEDLIWVTIPSDRGE